jgi:hypothetical protein
MTGIGSDDSVISDNLLGLAVLAPSFPRRRESMLSRRSCSTLLLSNPQEIIVNLWRTAEDAMQGARHDAVRALLVVGNVAARL